MKNVNKLSFISLAILSVACSSQHATDMFVDEEIRFSLDSSEDFLQNLVLDFYQPEETDSSLIGSVSIVCQDGDIIYIGDDNEYKLVKFDKNGKYLDQIGSRGQGAGEFTQFSYFFLNKPQNQLGILDENQQKILYFNLENGAFQKSEVFKGIVSNSCVPYGGGLLWYNQSYDGELSDKYFVQTNETGSLTKGFVGKNFKSGYLTGSSCPIFSNKEGVFGFTPYDMKLYQFAGDSVSVKYSISIDGFLTPTEEFLKKTSFDGESSSLFSRLSKSDYISYYNLEMTPSLLQVLVIRQKEKYIGLYDRINNREIFLKQDDFADRIGVGGISYFIQNPIDDYIVCVLDKEAIVEASESESAKIDSRLREYVESGNDNPIILKFKLL